MPAGKRHWPFVLRPQQILAIDELNSAICGEPQHDLLFDKSRKQGASELICGFYAVLWMLVPDTALLVTSRKEQYVDASTELIGNRVLGSPRCLFHKLLYKVATAPQWIRPRFAKSHLKWENLDNGSIIDGESTNPDLGAGDRRTSLLLDEFGRVQTDLAQSIRDSVSDVCDAVIYNSTHFYGRGHAFAKLRYSGKIKVFILPWWKNPIENPGLYRSPEAEKLEIIDKKYDFGSYKFILKGDNKYRSPWYDGQEKRRDARDVACNLDMNPAGAGDIFFDHDVLLRIRTEWIKPPDYVGSIDFRLVKDKIRYVKFSRDKGNDFRWWGKLVRNRPDQDHNYVVSADIGLGTGASNSVCKVYDVDTNELVGMFLSSKIPPHEFCDQVMAICQWVSGQNRWPFLVWDASGGTGAIFDQRRRVFGYNNVYIDTITRSKYPKRTKKPGFYCTRIAKDDALLELRTALAEGLKTEPTGKFLRIYDEMTLGEYEDYVFYENGDIGLSGNVTDTGGAKKAHGDCVIPDAMAVHVMRGGLKAISYPATNIIPGTLGW